MATPQNNPTAFSDGELKSSDCILYTGIPISAYSLTHFRINQEAPDGQDT
jgi:hypothetical protein